MRNRQFFILPMAALMLSTGVAFAGVSPQEAARLGGPELTPVGAERAGNEEGTIPPWTGGIREPLPGFEPGDHHPDPFAADPVLFTINAANADRYADKLSEGQRALLSKYPDSWYMNVYPTRRSAAYPEFVYEAIKANATRAELITEGLGGIAGAAVASPFPLPQQGVELIWNHTLRWRGIRASRVSGQAAITRLGNYRVVLFQEEFAFPYGNPRHSPGESRYPHTSIAFKQKILAPGALTGFGHLLLEPLDYTRQQRQSWVYNANLRRVMRRPTAGFDAPAPQSDGLRFQDEMDMFNGSPALFDWKLLGKREFYIPYNDYKLHSGAGDYDDILKERHINPQLVRYELHRVWVVEGTVRSAERNHVTHDPLERGHAYSRRVFFLDEDTWQIAMADNYDGDGKLWRHSEGHMVNYYDVPVPWYTLEVFYDLKVRRYLANGLDNRRDTYRFTDTYNPKRFSPLALEFFVR